MRRECNFVRKDGRKCKWIALRDSDRCKQHAGTRMLMIRKHGLYSKYQPPELDTLIEEQRNNPKLLDLREQVVLVSSLLAYSMDQIRQRQEAMDKARRAGKLNKKHADQYPLRTGEIRELVALSSRVSDTIERTARIGLVVRYLVHLDTVEKVLQDWQELAREFIPSVSKRDRFNRLLSVRARQIVEEEAEAARREKKGGVQKLKEWRETFGQTDPETQILDLEEK